MPVDYCPNCSEMRFASLTHRCEPLWYVRLDWHEKGDERKVFAQNAREAAEKFCQRDDAHGDYHIIQSGEAKAVVYDRTMRPVGMFEVQAESVPHYYATPARLTDKELAALAHEDDADEDEEADEAAPETAVAP